MNKLNKITITSILCSIFALIGIILYFNIQKNNIILIPILYFFYKLFCDIFKKITKKDIYFCCIISLIYSTLLILGYQLDTFNGLIYNIKTLILLICLPFFLFLIIYYLLTFITSLNIKTDTTISDKKIKFFTFLGIFIPWFLGFLALFPGIYGYDAGFQFMEFSIENYTITSHFSILHSYLFYFLVNLGKILFNNYQVGFALYAFLQLTFLSFVAYKICTYIYMKFKNIKLLIITICFFALSPFNMILSISSCQDSIFAGIFALIVLMTVQLIENTQQFWMSWKKPLLYCILVVLLCAFRNNGLYAFIIFIPFAIILLKEYKIKFIALIFLIITIFEIYSRPIQTMLNVQKGDSIREMSSVIVQQFGRVYCYRKDSLSQEELNYITQLINPNTLEIYQYTPCISDTLKANLDINYLQSDYKQFVKKYISIGLKNPITYIEAFLLNNIGTWYPCKTYPDSRMYHPYIEYEMLDAHKWNDNYIIIERNSLLPTYEKLLNIFINHSLWNKLPLISTLFSTGTYFFIFIFIIAYLFYNKQYRYIIPLSLILGLYITVLLAPVSLYRYNYPIIFTVPLICSFIFKKTVKSTKDIDINK